MYPKKQSVRYLRANLKRTPAKQTESLAKTKPTKKKQAEKPNSNWFLFWLWLGPIV